jgi:hypothetical protein
MASNPSCADLDPSYQEVKLDKGAAGSWNVGDGTISGTITIAAGSQSATFTVNPGVDAAILKYSTESKVYSYDPDATSGTLDTDGVHAISHVSLCYGPDEPPVTPDPDPQPTPDPDPEKTPEPQPQPQPEPQPQPQIQVLGETASGGPSIAVAGRSAIHGPSSCVKKAFTVRITGRRIAKVTFRIDGRTVKSSGRKLRVSPARYGAGLHRVEARVQYVAASGSRPRTHRFVFQRCAQQAVAPQFAG